MTDTSIVIIAKPPQLGTVKTRLAASLGVHAALAIYLDLLAITARAVDQWPGPVLLCAAGVAEGWERCGWQHLPRRQQPDGGLGTRIADALHWGLTHTPHVIAIGTDCPALTGQHLMRLAARPDLQPVAFGPASDGGYWGICVTDALAIPHVTDDALPWSTNRLLATTCARLDAAHISYAMTDLLSDCDDESDLERAISAGYLSRPLTCTGAHT